MMRQFPILCAAAGLAFGALAAPIPKEKEPPPATEKQREQAQNNLKQIVLAMHNHESAYQCFPHDITGEKGVPLLSWRVALLPFLEEGELYKQFKLNEPWDSKTNKPLVAKMPKIFAPVRRKAEEGETFYRGFTGKGAPFEKGLQLKIQTITDGTSNTIAVIEAGEAVVWTKPESDIPFDAKKPLPKLGADIDGDFHAALLDGSVLIIKREFDEATMKAAITHGDGEVIDIEKLSPEKK